jgi:cell division protein FtsI (penicillin-binding protein 3)
MAMNLVQDHFRKKAGRRTRLLALVCVLWLGGVVGRLIQLQVFGHTRAEARILEQNQSTTKIQAPRGTIFDRNGNILARSLPACSIYYMPNPSEPFATRFEPVRRLQTILDLSGPEMEKIKSQVEKNVRFIWLKLKANPDLAAKVWKPRAGIGYQEETKRIYPLGRQASQVLGSVNFDGLGTSGIESKYNFALQGQDGRAFILRDAKKREYHYEVLDEPENGRDIVLTLDETIQYIAQNELEKALAATGAAWGTVLVSHPSTGEILAMATAPAPDHNKGFSPDAAFNHAVQNALEPGSTFKIVTAAAAIENHAASFSDTFDCSEGSISVAGGPIRDHKAFGILDFPSVIINSSNVGTIKIGQRLGPAPFVRMIEAFGFGRKTGIELPSEATGRFTPADRWSKRSLASLSIGYEIAVTPLQLLQAVNVIANRGDLIPPRIVKSVEGRRSPKTGPPPLSVLSAAACEKLIGILERVVLEGTGKAALAEGYDIAGKTGTTQKFDPIKKEYSSTRHIASFVGFVPADNPILSMVVILDDPRTEEYYGGQVAAPVFRAIVKRALRAFGVHPRPRGGLLTAGLPEDHRP